MAIVIHMEAGALHARIAALVQAGLCRAEQGLEAMLGAPVSIGIEDINLEPVQGAAQVLPAPGGDGVGVHVRFSGDLAGHGLLCLTGGEAARLAGLILARTGLGDSLAQSALLELGNMTVSGFVNGIADAGRWQIRVSPPALAQDTGAVLIQTVLAAADRAGRTLLSVRTSIRCQDQNLKLTLLLLPDASSLQALATAERG